MAAGALPRPGTKYGPCDAPCAHTDCASVRAQADSPCTYCGKPIGYETRFYDERSPEQRQRYVNNVGYAHATCVEDAIEAQ